MVSLVLTGQGGCCSTHTLSWFIWKLPAEPNQSLCCVSYTISTDTNMLQIDFPMCPNSTKKFIKCNRLLLKAILKLNSTKQIKLIVSFYLVNVKLQKYIYGDPWFSENLFLLVLNFGQRKFKDKVEFYSILEKKKKELSLGLKMIAFLQLFW